jgi:hypothetical protein
MMTLNEMQEIVFSCSYRPGWMILFRMDRGEDGKSSRPYIQVEVDETTEAARNAFTGKAQAWRGGKVYLSQHMCRQEIVGACFGAIRAAEEHEMREWFRYRGRSIFNPHLDPDVLAEVAVRKNMNVRDNAMTMKENSK